MPDPTPTSAPARRRLRRRVRSVAGRAAVAVLAALCGRLPWRASQRLGRRLGGLAYVLAARERRRTLEHLGIAFPELSAAARRRLARDCFRHLGTTLAECLHLARRSCTELGERVAVEGWERLEAALADDRPLLVFTGHCGNWELLAAAANCRSVEIAVVARRLDDAGFQRLLVDFRARFGTPTIERGASGAARRLLEVFRSGAGLAMLIDQDTRVDGVWVPFFGRPAYTPVGAAEIALRKGCVVLPCFIERLADGSHRARFEPPLELPDDPTAATALMTERIEAQIRRRPEQWVWMHRRWRHQPPAM